MTVPRQLRISIDRLVLHGIAHGDAAAVQRALTQALQARLAQVDLASLTTSRAALTLTVNSQNDPAALGRSAGGALGAKIAGGLT